MRKLFSLLLILMVTLGMMVQTVDAKRFGGGRSFGVQRSVGGFSRMQSTPQMPRPASSASKWLGPLAGLAAGGLLASLMMGHGLGSGLLSWLAIAGVGLLLFSFFRNKMQPAAQAAQFGQQRQGNVYDASSQFAAASANAQTASYASSQLPIGFDSTEFVRDAKILFIRMQAAYDSKNLNDLREFTAPEVFAEIQMQLQERGDEVNHTEVVSLNAELLNAESELQSTFATVQFTGSIKESMNASAEALKEVWHFRKYNNQGKWLVAGVQQLLH